VTETQLTVHQLARYVNAVIALVFAHIALPAPRWPLVACSAAAFAGNAVLHAYARLTGRRREAAYALLVLDLLTIGPAIALTGMLASPFLIVLPLTFSTAYFVERRFHVAWRYGVACLALLAGLFAAWWWLDSSVAGWNARAYPAFAFTAFAVQATALATLIHQAASLPDPLVQELARQEAELARQAHRAELGASMASVVHELRNPLSTLSFILEAVEDAASRPGGPDPARLRSQAQTGRAEIVRLNEMLESLLAYAREKHSRLNLGPHEPAALVARAAGFMRLKGRRQADALTVDVQVAGAPPVLCDPDAMHQVLVNLFDNAVQHRMPGQPPRVEVRASARQDRVQITIRDNGTGIPPDLLPRVFDRFVTGRPGGTGLGLFIARQLVEAQGGTIEVTSVEGAGATFLITLPVAPEPVPPGSPAPSGGTSGTAGAPRAPAPGRSAQDGPRAGTS
jgi:signal transduction histidine kinase